MYAESQESVTDSIPYQESDIDSEMSEMVSSVAVSSSLVPRQIPSIPELSIEETNVLSPRAKIRSARKDEEKNNDGKEPEAISKIIPKDSFASVVSLDAIFTSAVSLEAMEPLPPPAEVQKPKQRRRRGQSDASYKDKVKFIFIIGYSSQKSRKENCNGGRGYKPGKAV